MFYIDLIFPSVVKEDLVGIQGIVVPFCCEGRPGGGSRFPSIMKENLVGIQGVVVPFCCEGRPGGGSRVL
ncbi:hypothetical protein Taro_036119 [Colocasia esculenta]|uniref:Uncharacterized protein n=1 Tax=Colocasia esculenta TaxID=4460 RepID=A0A843W8R3_COLES|nr:hypothetical protein [Colocasia esculenta]